MASVMKGKFFGGGMKIAPNQDRFDSDNLISCLVAHNLSRFKILSLFITIFRGTHIKHIKHVSIKKCREVKVEFDRPTSLQIDGEPIENVDSYTVLAKAKESIHT